ncbi:NAD-P-binding protein [Trametes elegans]|nr:NAD-P-binding protein [Trametes elegans]
MPPSTPRVWLITGSSSGLGLDVVRCVLAKGDIAVATLRRPEVLADLVAQHPAERLLVLKLDVTIPSDITAAFAKAREAFGRVDVVVSNAGYTLLGEIEGTPDDAARAMFEVDFWGAAHILQEAVRFMREVNPPGRGGRIIQITSGTGISGFPGCGFYSAGKHAVEGLAETLAKEADSAWNIKITLIPLGGFVTKAVSTSMVKLPPHPAYLKPGLPSTLSRQAVLAGTPDVKGDTAKAAQALYRLSELQDPPMHLVLGKDAIILARKQWETFSAEIDQYEAWSDGLEKD